MRPAFSHHWDPALTDALADGRRVITFDNAGVGGSTGETPDTIEQMARDAIAFITALGLDRIDLPGFSIGSFVAQEIALRRPALVRRLVLASSAPKGAPGMHGWAPAVIGAVGKQETGPDEYLGVFFTGSAESQQAGQETPGWATRRAQYDAVCTWGIPDHMILPRYSHLLAGLIPRAELKIYPDAAHGFLFQHHVEFAADVARFLGFAE